MQVWIFVDWLCSSVYWLFHMLLLCLWEYYHIHARLYNYCVTLFVSIEICSLKSYATNNNAYSPFLFNESLLYFQQYYNTRRAVSKTPLESNWIC